MNRSDRLLQLQHRLAEVTAVVYMGAHVGVYGRLALGGPPDSVRIILLYSTATAFYLSAFYLAAALWKRGRSFWSLTLTAAMAVQMVSSSISLVLYTRGSAGMWEAAANIVAGPMTQLYAWSLFTYSLVAAGIAARGRPLRHGLILSMDDTWLSSLLTIGVIVALPLLVVLSATGAVELDVAGGLIHLVNFWNPLIYVVLSAGYLMLYRMEGAATVRYLAYLFFVSVLAAVTGGLAAAVGTMSGPGQVLRFISFALPAVQIYLWLRATQEA